MKMGIIHKVYCGEGVETIENQVEAGRSELSL